MTDIAICILEIIGILVCRIIEYSIWEHDREKTLGCEFEQQEKENRNEIHI